VVGYPDAELHIALLRLPGGVPAGRSGAYAEMKAKGVRFTSEPVAITHGRNAGGKAVYFFDPDDVTLELIPPTPRA
jgi:hypothetical protein